MSSRIINADVIDGLRQLPDGHFQCCSTSPPFWGLRNYNVDGQIGLEPTLSEYLDRLVSVFGEVRRVLREDGVCFVEIGDTYNSQNGFHRGNSYVDGGRPRTQIYPDRSNCGLKPKDLCLVPQRLAIALQEPREAPCCVPDHINRAWLAAMFDGEGSIGVRRFRSYREQQEYQDGFVVYTTIANNDVELLDRCIEITGYGKAWVKSKAGSVGGGGIKSRRDCYGWRLDGNAAVDVIRAIYPHLIAKRKQACIAYTLDELNKVSREARGNGPVPGEIQDKKRLCWEMVKKCNQREPIDLPDWVIEPKPKIEPGWYVRSDIIWSRPNPMPESVSDRPTKAHSYVYLLTKNARYFYDAEAVREKYNENSIGRYQYQFEGSTSPGRHQPGNKDLRYLQKTTNQPNPAGRNLRSVWHIPTQSFPDAHFATFPEALVERCLKAGTSSKGCCPECGAPWARVVEAKNIPTRGNSTVGPGYIDHVYGHDRSGHKPGVQIKTITGWRPGCDCKQTEDSPAPCRVLDPFRRRRHRRRRRQEDGPGLHGYRIEP